MQQEDDLRALGKIMDLLRAISVMFVITNIYWYCYQEMQLWGFNTAIVDRILTNFDDKVGLFSSIVNTKLCALLMLALSCLGTRGVVNEKIKWWHIGGLLGVGGVLFFLNWWATGTLYIVSTAIGYICLLMAGLYMSRLLRANLMDDRFNDENESFQQESRLIENEYSVNLPSRFYHNKRWNSGWINVVNPFRATIVLGTPGSGKSYAVVNNFIKQQIEKGYSQYIYDYKFPDLSKLIKK